MIKFLKYWIGTLAGFALIASVGAAIQKVYHWVVSLSYDNQCLITGLLSITSIAIVLYLIFETSVFSSFSATATDYDPEFWNEEADWEDDGEDEKETIPPPPNNPESDKPPV